MFELYDIFDNNEINVILLIVLILFLVFIIGGLGYYDYKMRLRLEKLQGDVNSMSILFDDNNNKRNNNNKNNNTDKEDKKNNNGIDYKEKYEELVKSKDVMDPTSMQYSPSEYATLLKYNPILPYSAFTMDIINNSYMDYNERGNMYDDKYFALSNYDNIYNQSNNNSNSNQMNNATNLSAEDQSVVDLASMDKNINDDKPNEMKNTNTNTNTNTPPTNPNSGQTDTKF